MQAYRAYCLRFALTTCLAVAAAPASLSGAPPDSQPSSTALESLQGWLGRPRDQRPPLKNESFSSSALTKEDAAKAQNLLWQDHAAWIRSTRADEMKAKRIELGKLPVQRGIEEGFFHGRVRQAEPLLHDHCCMK